MKILLVLLIAVAAVAPAFANTGDLDRKMQLIQPQPQGAGMGASNAAPATEAEVMQLIDALGVKPSLQASINATTPIVRQAYTDLLNKTMQEQGVRLTPEQTSALSSRITDKYNKLKTAMYDWMIKQYVKRHQASYTQAETMQILEFMKSPVGQKYVKNDSQTWGAILTEANNEFVKLIPQTVAQAFREAGALRGDGR